MTTRPSDPLIYLVCRSSSQGRLTANLQLLTAPAADMVPYALPIHRDSRAAEPFTTGRSIVLVLSEDSRHYYPFRSAQIATVSERGSHIEMQLELGDWLVPEAPAYWSEEFSTELDRDRSFLVTSAPLTPPGVAEEIPEEYWRLLVAHMSENARYIDTLFYRPHPVQVVQGRATLPVEFHNPHLGNAGGLPALEVVTNSEGIEEVLGVLDVQESGVASYLLPPSFAGGTLLLRAAAHRTRSWQYRVEIPPLAARAGGPAKGPTSPVVVEDLPVPLAPETWLLRMLQFSAKHLSIQPEMHQEFLEEYLLPLFPQNGLLRTRLAFLHLDQKRPERAYELLSPLPPQALGEAGSLTLLKAATQSGQPVNLPFLFRNIDFTLPRSLQSLREALATLHEIQGLALLKQVVDEYLDEAQAIHLLDGWSDSFPSSAATLAVADYLSLYQGDTAALEYLLRKGEDFPACWEDLTYRDRLLAFATKVESVPNRESLLLRLTRYGVKESDGAVSRIVALARRQLSRATARMFLEQLIALNLPFQQIATRVEIHLTLSQLYKDDLELDAAAEAMVAAKLIAGDDPSLAELVQLHQEALEEQLKQTQLLRDYLHAGDEGRIADLRPLLVGRRLLVLNSYVQPWVPQLESELGISVTWYESQKGQKLALDDVVEAIRSRTVAAVAINTYRAGHSGEAMIKAKCKENGVDWCYVPKHTKKSMVQSLWDALIKKSVGD